MQIGRRADVPVHPLPAAQPLLAPAGVQNQNGGTQASSHPRQTP